MRNGKSIHEDGASINVSGICEVGELGDEILNRSNLAPILHIPC